MGQWVAKAEETALTERSVYRILNLRRRILLSTVATEPEGANAYFLRHDVPRRFRRRKFSALTDSWSVRTPSCKKKGADVYEFIKRARLPLVEIAANES